MIFILFFVISLVFFVIHLAPGNPSYKYLSPKISHELYNQIAESFKLNGSLLDQYFAFVGNITKGEFGISYNFRRDVISVIKPYFLFTLIFSTVSFMFQMFISFSLVSFSYFSRNKRIEKIFTKLNLILYSTPVFISSLFLIFIFSYKLNLLPSSGLSSIFIDNMNGMELTFDYMKHLILPILASVFVGLPIYYKYLLEAVKMNASGNYIKNLQIIGMSKTRIFFKHVIPNSMVSFVAVAGIEFGALLSGSVILESIFALPGLGRLTLNAVLTRDYPLVVGAVLFSASIILLINFFADIIRALIDRRTMKSILS